MEDNEVVSFDAVLNIQRLMQLKHYPQIELLSMEEQLLINTRAMSHEVAETENELNWKHWKQPVEIDEEKIANEIVDQFIFLMNQINIIEMDANELFDRTLEKIEINIARQSSGY